MPHVRICAGGRGVILVPTATDLRTLLFQMCGVDLTRIDGIDVTTALAVVSESGEDMTRFPSIKHFTSARVKGVVASVMLLISR